MDDLDIFFKLLDEAKEFLFYFIIKFFKSANYDITSSFEILFLGVFGVFTSVSVVGWPWEFGYYLLTLFEFFP